MSQARSITRRTAAPGGLEAGTAGPRLGLALLVIATAQLMVVLDATIVNVALPHIQRALGFSGSSLEWVVTAYALAFGGMLCWCRAGIGAPGVHRRAAAVFRGVAGTRGSPLSGVAAPARAVQGAGAIIWRLSARSKPPSRKARSRGRWGVRRDGVMAPWA
jgi:MFS family permease